MVHVLHTFSRSVLKEVHTTILHYPGSMHADTRTHTYKVRVKRFTYGYGKKREREAGGGQTGRDNETRSETNDATAMTVAKAPASGIPTATPAQVTNKRHKTTASTPSIEPS